MRIFALILLICVLSGCESIPIKDGELAVGKDTTATIDDGAVAKLKGRF